LELKLRQVIINLGGDFIYNINFPGGLIPWRDFWAILEIWELYHIGVLILGH